MQKNLTILIFILFLSNKAFTQKRITDTIAVNLIEKIAAHDIWESDLIGSEGDSSEQFKNFKDLSKIISSEQMLDLVKNHKNRVVKCYALLELKKTNTKIPTRIINKIKRDKIKMNTLVGCMGRKHTIAAFLNL